MKYIKNILLIMDKVWYLLSRLNENCLDLIYFQVMLHPGLYPTNKENLPPYPEDSHQDRTGL